jgi:hypothetical protein
VDQEAQAPRTEGGMMDRLAEWFMHGDTGVSSESIACALSGSAVTPRFGGDVPKDPDDFGRCYRLLTVWMPEWKDRIGDVAARFPKWKPLVPLWPKMMELYASFADASGYYRWREIEGDKKKAHDALYEMLRNAYDDCMIADGYVRTSPHSWQRGESLSVELTPEVSKRIKEELAKRKKKA